VLDLPHVVRLHVEFQKHPLFRDTVAKARTSAIWEFEANETIERLFPDDKSLAAAVEGYCRFCVEIMRLQVDFNKTGSYAQNVNPTVDISYMADTYLPGLLLSWFLWPHHYRQLRFFEEAFVSPMRHAQATRFYEVATGTGLYSRKALQGCQTVVGVGFDISPSSCTFTENHVGAFGLRERYRVLCSDPIEDIPEPTDWLICVELLEHVSDPLRVLRSLRRMLSPNGRAFITTAINAPSSDHTYLYTSPDEVVSQLEEAGFTVEDARQNHAETGPASVAAFLVR